jgi:hypothetical protein
MAFFCQQCGECCSHMHQIHQIEEDCGNHTFRIRNVYNGDRTRVCIDPDKVDLFSDPSVFETWPEACPFLRSDPARGRICCIVHRTRPELCREFGCWRLLILDPAGRRAGRIMGSRHLSTEDPALRRLWEEEAGPLQGLEEMAWEDAVVRILEKAGYRVYR